MKGMRSLGVPGAGLMLDPEFSTPTPGTAQHGIAEVKLYATMIDSLPKKLSSDSECHWLFSFHDRFVGTEILSVGVTPTGQLHAVAPDGTTATTAAGVFVPDGTEREIILTWIGFGAIGQLQCTGMAPLTIGAAGPTQYAVPITASSVCLLNGRDAIARHNVLVRRLETTWLSLTDVPCYVVYDFSEGEGDTVGADVTGDPMLSGFDMKLTRRWMQEYSCPWPDVDYSNDPASALTWVRKTDFRRITHNATKFRRRGTTWLS